MNFRAQVECFIRTQNSLNAQGHPGQVKGLATRIWHSTRRIQHKKNASWAMHLVNYNQRRGSETGKK